MIQTSAVRLINTHVYMCIHITDYTPTDWCLLIDMLTDTINGVHHNVIAMVM